MRQTRSIILTPLFAALVVPPSCTPAHAQTGREQPRPVHGVNPADMDPAADPRQDFYRGRLNSAGRREDARWLSAAVAHRQRRPS